MIKSSARQLVYQHIQEALLYHSRYKRGEGVPHMMKAYLEALEERSAVSNYLLGLKRLEHKAVEMYLDGKRVEAIKNSRVFQTKEVPMNQLRVWIYGDREQFGLINTMFGVFMRQASFCPFCHDQKRWGDQGYQKRLHGSVCPCREMWAEEMAEECDS